MFDSYSGRADVDAQCRPIFVVFHIANIIILFKMANILFELPHK
jgi:hypothetical protein